MQILHAGVTYDFDKWPKWRRLDTSIELLVLEGETILDYQREGNSLYLFMEGGMVHEQATAESTAVGLLVLEWVGINNESYGDEPGAPIDATGMAYLTGSIPTLLQLAPSKYKRLHDRFRFEVDRHYSGGPELQEAVLWDFKAQEMTAYWKERL